MCTIGNNCMAMYECMYEYVCLCSRIQNIHRISYFFASLSFILCQFRSPEEYSNAEQTEKVDIYSIGNIFYVLLTEYWPFEGMEEKKAQEMILSGERPPVGAELLNSKDSSDVALIEAMRMCWEEDPIARATANDVKDYLMAAMKRSQRKQE